jgi:hypothetical protein
MMALVGGCCRALRGRVASELEWAVEVQRQRCEVGKARGNGARLDESRRGRRARASASNGSSASRRRLPSCV